MVEVVESPEHVAKAHMTVQKALVPSHQTQT